MIIGDVTASACEKNDCFPSLPRQGCTNKWLFHHGSSDIHLATRGTRKEQTASNVSSGDDAPMKSQESVQQPSSMDSSDSGVTTTSSSEYAYRPLTTKHRRAGSTGTTGDEEYTSDEDELDEADCCHAVGASHPMILKSDLARAATDLFGYGNAAACKKDAGDEPDEPTSLFDDDDAGFGRERPSPLAIFSFNEGARLAATAPRRRSSAGSDKCHGSGKPSAPSSRTAPEPAPECHGPAGADGQFDGSSGSKGEADGESDEHEPASPSAAQRGRAPSETDGQRQIAQLQDELRRAREELKLKDEEVARLSRIRQDVEAELEELTASLFQEAHNMVREANQCQATAERLLEESRMKAEVLAAEVAALKTLVLTSTPARPNPHLHPQICSSSSAPAADDGQQQATGGIFAKRHRRSPSHFNLKYGRESSPPDSPHREPGASLPCDAAKDAYERDLDRERERHREREKKRESRELGLEVDPRVHAQFLRWKASPCVDKGEPFVERIFREDIDLCLDFPNAELGAKVRQAVLDGIIFVEAVSDKAKQGFPKKCALLEAPRQCHYRMRISDQENQWHCISQICRNRIIAVCDFLNYLRYIERGLVKSSVHDVYWEITRLRKEMVLARLGLALSS
ncbi:guanine nucleotide exchange factor for Rab-3A-like isoform X2 [Phymastichus coffea]|uniref:guanine nucleotide exchange factor for Rab-3A-like isoform X2 n=1 Tax=Phymastichus coffea TaxID=108790 RepID=UPI00273B0C2E|nr:guanine nucleotide exchange factor for Rab-3A-like isoform X2 [Phymastichus coffea]